jgi:hypothetical protein
MLLFLWVYKDKWIFQALLTSFSIACFYFAMVLAMGLAHI